MYLEYFHLNYPPFATLPDPEVFFHGAGREEIINGLAEDFINGKPLVKVTGNKGSGKTLLCKYILQQPLGRQFELVYLDNPTGSLNDLLFGVCKELGADVSMQPERDMLAELQTILSLKKEKGAKVLLIIDEAEQLFLAALERLMRLICESSVGHVLHVLLVGRPALNVSLEQLTAYCADVDVDSGYRLSPFTLEETREYLHYRVQEAGNQDFVGDEIFSPDSVEKIDNLASGDINRINTLAEESLQAAAVDHSSLVSPHHVVGAANIGKAVHISKPKYAVVWTRKNQIFAGAVVALLAVLVFVFSGDDKHHNEDIVEIPEQEIQVTPLPEEEVIIPEPVKPLATVVAPLPDKQEDVSEEILGPVVANIPDPVDPEQLTGGQGEEPIIELHPDRVKVSPEESRQIVIIHEPPARVAVVKPRVIPAERVDVNPRGEKIYQERIRASAKWLANAYHNRYTVQMMMLASELAGPNLKRMLAQDEYATIKDYLYILTKKTSPPTLFVFYGTYDSMEQARQARNTMPLFLRKHHPYALSINDAMKKNQD